MNANRKRQLLWIGAMLAGVAIAVALILFAIRSQTDFFYNPSQLLAGDAPTSQRIRAGGMVVEGSVQREPNTVNVNFEITDFNSTIPVRFSGVLPDLFAENSGMVGTGQWRDGMFWADEILARNDENYMPVEVERMLDENTPHGRVLPDGSPAAIPVSRSN